LRNANTIPRITFILNCHIGKILLHTTHVGQLWRVGVYSHVGALVHLIKRRMIMMIKVKMNRGLTPVKVYSTI